MNSICRAQTFTHRPCQLKIAGYSFTTHNQSEFLMKIEEYDGEQVFSIHISWVSFLRKGSEVRT